MRMLLTGAAALAAIAMIAPANAQTADAGAYGSAALQRGDTVKAELALEQERRAAPDQPEVLLNLATVYARTDRDAQAAALYRAVLAQENVSMKLAHGRSMDSHDLARIGLSSLGAGEMTTASAR